MSGQIRDCGDVIKHAVGKPENQILSYRAAADLLGMKVATLYSKVHRHEVPHLRLNARCVRFERSVLLEWLASKAVPAREDGGQQR